MGNTHQRSDLTTKRSHAYSWLQRKGPGPGHEWELFSTNGALNSVEESMSTPEPIYRKSVVRRGDFDKVGETSSPPDASTASFSEKVPRATAALLERLKRSGREFSVKVVISQAADPADANSWESMLLLEGVKLTSFSRGDVESGDAEDAEWEISADANWSGSERVFPLYFGEEAASTITVEVLDVAVYPPDDRDDADEKEIYYLTKVVSTTAPVLVYSKDGGSTWTAVSLTEVGNNAPNRIKIVGDYLLITSAAALKYFWARRSAPATWAGVTSGFVSSKGPTGIYAPAVGALYFAGAGGYVYKTTVPGSAVTQLSSGDITVQNLAAIHGAGDCLVAVGASNAMIVSYNAGRTWSLVTGPASGVALNNVLVWDKDRWFVCADKLYFTDDSGVTWVESPLNVTGMTVVKDVISCTELQSVMYCVGQTSTEGWIMRSEDGGASWENYSLETVPSTAQAWNCVGVGGVNHVVIGGLGATTDGIAAIGSAT